MSISPLYMTTCQLMAEKPDKNSDLLKTMLDKAKKNLSQENGGVSEHNYVATLRDYVFVGADVQEKLDKEFGVEKIRTGLKPYFSFDERLKETPLAVLERINLYVMSRTFDKPETSDVWAALVGSAPICELSITKIGDYRASIDVIATRLDVISQKEPDLFNKYAAFEKGFLSLFNIFRSFDFPVGQFRHLSGGELGQIASKLHCNAFFLVTDAQFAALDFNKLSGEQIDAAIAGDQVEETAKKRLATMTPDQIRNVFLKSNKYTSKMPLEAYQSCPLSRMGREKIGRIFTGNNEKEIFEKFDPVEVAKALKDIDYSKLKNMTEDQIRVLDISRMDFCEIGYIFDSYADDDKIKSKKVQAISAEQLNANGHCLPLNIIAKLSPAQKTALNFSALKWEQRDVLLRDRSFVETLAPSQVAANSHYYTTSMLEKLSSQQKAFLDLSALNDLQRRTLFNDHAFVRALPTDALNRYLPQLSKNAIPQDALGMLDLQRMTQDQLKGFFPPFTDETLYPGHTKTVRGDLVSFEKNEENSRFKTTTTKESFERLLESNKQTCLAHFKLISPAQFNSIRSKLDPEVAALYSPN